MAVAEAEGSELEPGQHQDQGRKDSRNVNTEDAGPEGSDERGGEEGELQFPKLTQLGKRFSHSSFRSPRRSVLLLPLFHVSPRDKEPCLLA